MLPSFEIVVKINIKFNIKSDEQLEKVKQMTKDDTVVIRGQITDVGEFMQYTMNIDSID